MKLKSVFIKKIFGNDVDYIEIRDNQFITRDALLTIIYECNSKKLDTEITVQDYFDKIDDAFKRGVI